VGTARGYHMSVLSAGWRRRGPAGEYGFYVLAHEESAPADLDAGEDASPRPVFDRRDRGVQ
jgi:hypothetical protein